MKKMQIKIILLFTIYIWAGVLKSYAQLPYSSYSEQPDIISSAYLEIWGNSGGFTINYDFIVNSRSGMRVGLFGFTDRDLNEIVSTGIVMTGNLFFGSDVHKLELGAGGFFDIRPDKSDTDFLMTTTTGYRLHPRNNKSVFRLGFTPAFTSDEFRWQFGISYGRRLSFTSRNVNR